MTLIILISNLTFSIEPSLFVEEKAHLNRLRKTAARWHGARQSQTDKRSLSLLSSALL